MKTVAQMVDDVIRREGGYVDHQADRGGPTKYGVTLATLQEWRGPMVQVTKADVKRLSKREAIEIYRTEYFYRPGIDKLPENIQPFMFDAMVNHNPKDAVRFLQSACLDGGFDPGPLDGIIGPRTIAAAERYVRKPLDGLISRREQFYHGLVARNPSQRVFLAGWLNRLDEFRA